MNKIHLRVIRLAFLFVFIVKVFFPFDKQVEGWKKQKKRENICSRKNVQSGHVSLSVDSGEVERLSVAVKTLSFHLINFQILHKCGFPQANSSWITVYSTYDAVCMNVQAQI